MRMIIGYLKVEIPATGAISLDVTSAHNERAREWTADRLSQPRLIAYAVRRQRVRALWSDPASHSRRTILGSTWRLAGSLPEDRYEAKALECIFSKRATVLGRGTVHGRHEALMLLMLSMQRNCRMQCLAVVL